MRHRIQTLDEQRIRAFLARESALSETAPSLAAKLGLSVHVVRLVLERCAQAGELSSQRFERDTETIYYRFEH